MSIDEIRSAFLGSGDAQRLAETWRDQLASHFTSVEGRLSRERQAIYMCTHICPLSVFSGGTPPAFDARPVRDHQPRLKTVSTDNSNCRPHYDGLITEDYSPTNELRERLLVCRDFKIEAVFQCGGQLESQKAIWAASNEQRINGWLTHFLWWGKANKYPFPAIAMTIVLNAEGSHVMSSWHNHAATADTMKLRSVFLEDDTVNASTIMRPAYDHLWQSYGFDECILFDENGQFDRNRYNQMSV